jgi:hypothetical protein
MTDRALIGSTIGSIVLSVAGAVASWRTGHHLFTLVFVVVVIVTGITLASVVMEFGGD